MGNLVIMPDGRQVVLPDNPTPEQQAMLDEVMRSKIPGKGALEQANPEAAMQSEYQDALANWKQAQAAHDAAYKALPWDKSKVTPEMAQAYRDAQANLAATRSAVDAAKNKWQNYQEDVLRQKADSGDLVAGIRHWANMAGNSVLRSIASLPALAASAGVAMDPGRGGTDSREPMAAAASIGPDRKTKAEQYVSSGVEGATSALTNPGASVNLVRNALIGASGGVGGQVAADAFGDNVLSRIGGALVGGGIPAALAGRVPTAVNTIRKDMSALGPDDLAAALEKEATLRKNGMAYSATQLFGDKSTLQDTFERAAGNQFVRPRVLGKLSDARTSASDALTNWRAENLPPTGASSRQVLADVQDAAASKIANLKTSQANNAYADALPTEISSAPVDTGAIKQGIATLRARAADPDYHGRLSAGGEFLNDIAGKLEAGLKMAEESGNPLLNGEVNNLLKTLNTYAEAKGYKGTALSDAKAILGDMTPDFGPARAAKADFIREQVNPVEQGLTGQLAKMGGGVKPDKYTASATAVPMVLNKDRVQTSEIADLSKQVGPDNVAALLQEHLSKAQNSALHPTTSIAAKVQQPFFMQALSRGEPGSALRQNVDASLREAAKSYQIPASQLQGSFHKIMDALETYKDLRLPASVDMASIDQSVKRNVASAAVAPFSRAGRYIEDAVAARTYKQIADLAMHPDGAKLLISVGTSKDPSVLPAFLRSVMQSANTTPPAQQEP